jgi:hypothetical protein
MLTFTFWVFEMLTFTFWVFEMLTFTFWVYQLMMMLQMNQQQIWCFWVDCSKFIATAQYQ